MWNAACVRGANNHRAEHNKRSQELKWPKTHAENPFERARERERRREREEYGEAGNDVWAVQCRCIPHLEEPHSAGWRQSQSEGTKKIGGRQETILTWNKEAGGGASEKSQLLIETEKLEGLAQRI